MNYADAIIEEFEADLIEYEKNRMYPMGYRKESLMTKMTMHHISAISHAELWLEPAIAKAPEPRFAAQLTKDLDRLSEVKMFLMQIIANPKLPFEESEGK